VTAGQWEPRQGLRNHEHADRLAAVCVQGLAQGPGAACRDISRGNADPIAQVEQLQPGRCQVEKNSDGPVFICREDRAQGTAQKGSPAQGSTLKMACLWRNTRARASAAHSSEAGWRCLRIVGIGQGPGTLVDRWLGRLLRLAPPLGIKQRHRGQIVGMGMKNPLWVHD